MINLCEGCEIIMQIEFIPLVEDAIMRVKKYFSRRFIAAYLHGSLNYGDAIPNISDMDCYIVIKDDLNNDDKEWISSTQNQLQNKYPIINGVHLSTHSIDEVKRDVYTRFILKHNASLYSGIDIVEILNTKNFGEINPDKNIAKARLGFAKQCFDDALKGKQPACTGELPKNTYYIARKFARYFVIIEGAYWLMSINEFNSFKKEQVLMGLRKNCSEFNDIFDLTEKVLLSPVEAKISHEEFLAKINPFMIMVFKNISII